MFLRAYSKTKDGKPHTYYALVESVRTDAGPRQQMVAYLGELKHNQQRRWQRTVVFHNRWHRPIAGRQAVVHRAIVGVLVAE